MFIQEYTYKHLQYLEISSQEKYTPFMTKQKIHLHLPDRTDEQIEPHHSHNSL